MIALRIKTSGLPLNEPLVVRLRSHIDHANQHEACLLSTAEGVAEFDFHGFSFALEIEDVKSIDGDVVMFLPDGRSVHRLIRANSKHNTLLVTEQCDQLCLMCSQPPKKHHFDLFDQFATAVKLAPADATIGVSGGEPLLHKTRLFNMMTECLQERSDIKFHVLTNGQHLSRADLPVLSSSLFRRVLWGVPLYSENAATHDLIVGKPGAYERLCSNLAILGQAGSSVELRTVLMRENVEKLLSLASFISKDISFASVWALMQMENIGFARKNWNKQFYDNSLDFKPISSAMDLVLGSGLEVALYNFPRCTIPSKYRNYSHQAISDWKQKFLPQCSDCTDQTKCGGFFEWYPEDHGFENICPN
ncbi:His-Xaa-Ser system radical SAM maturase HxsC [Pseudovibrio denitrificans]|uniref:His-Xaa-Ser system radical SAM maturase HxsC n=1 Tax=Pseudovibrio denitrificans TaxID=258256 RepID=A0A1I7DZF3_9HYPH|nr:His-Xaa-Ser system radical SAM maturase HxsC [Pseudovibrio denitrificans]SFU17013.1 His-Xaa-Ser system radical SAM maturase HxsC [Pseudovibrio denitrificans]